jgi:hypothetical protein
MMQATRFKKKFLAVSNTHTPSGYGIPNLTLHHVHTGEEPSFKLELFGQASRKIC